MRRGIGDFTRTDIITSAITSGNGEFTPITAWMSSGDWPGLRGRWFQAATVDAEVRLAVQYSNDGQTVLSTKDLSTFASPTTAYTAVGATSLPAGATEGLLIRIGFQARRTNSGSVPLVLPILWRVVPIGTRAQQIALPPITLGTKESTSPIFVPVMDPFDASEFSEVRGTLEIQAVNAGAEVSLAYRSSPDGASWPNTAVLPGSSYETAAGVYYYAWTAVSPGASTKIQLGYMLKDTSTPTRVNFARVAGFVDVR